MTSKEFIIWLKGFITACNDYAPTPKQWDIIKEELEKVSDKQNLSGVPIGPGWAVPNTSPAPSLPYIDPYNPYKITCKGEETPTGTTITTTPGTGFITVANPYIASFGSGSTSTTYGYPSGSAWHYTNSSETHNED